MKLLHCWIKYALSCCNLSKTNVGLLSIIINAILDALMSYLSKNSHMSCIFSPFELWNIRYYFDHKFLDDVVRKICNSVRGVNRVVQDITSKPPSTIEWEWCFIQCLQYDEEWVRKSAVVFDLLVRSVLAALLHQI